MRRHGTQSCYGYGCRAPECRLAHNIYIARYKARREALGGREVRTRGMIGGRLTVPVEPTRREIEDLRRRKGFTLHRIAALAGLSFATVRGLMDTRRQFTHRHLADTIHSLWHDYFGNLNRREAA